MLIMLVDDSPVVLEKARSILVNGGLGYDILSFTSGREALDVLETTSVDVVLLDIMMPDMDGLEVLRRIKVRDPDVQVIMLTGRKDHKSFMDSMALGAVDYIEKPFEETELLARVRAAVQIKQDMERTQAEGLLRMSEGALSTIFDSVYDVIFICDLDGVLLDVNGRVQQMLGLDREQVLGMTIRDEYFFPDQPDCLTQLWERVIAGKDQLVECKARRIIDGREFDAEVFLKKITLDGREVILATVRDTTERKSAVEQVYDRVTGLYNRLYFEEKMRLFEGGGQDPVSIVVCALDDSELADHTQGHSAGDRLPKAVARLLRQFCRAEDVVARTGANEFAVLLPRADAATVGEITRRIVDEVNRINSMEPEPEIPLNISISCATRDNIPVTLDELIKRANDEMYQEKLLCRAGVRCVTVKTLLETTQRRDRGDSISVNRLQQLVADFGAALDLSEASLCDLRLLARFHDVGYEIPDLIRDKPGPLTPEERARLQRHCEVGYRIAQWVPELQQIADWILKHHEWWDGKGYPLGLKENEIPLECRIMAIAEAYDAMTSDRSYRKAMSHADAVAELRRCAGTQFDPELVEKFITVWAEQQK